MKARPCPLDARGRHKWEFVRNTSTATTRSGPMGTSVRLSARGLYQCTCGTRRLGLVDPNEPQSDLRDQVAEILK